MCHIVYIEWRKVSQLCGITKNFVGEGWDLPIHHGVVDAAFSKALLPLPLRDVEFGIGTTACKQTTLLLGLRRCGSTRTRERETCHT